jgi:hypothetical protein
MKHINTIAIAVILLFAVSFSTQAQNENNRWAIFLGVNAVDFYPTGNGMAPDYQMASENFLDDYFNVDEAIEIAQIAKEKNNDSFTYHMIHAIIVAQKKMNYNRCEVYSIPNEVRENSNLDVDMNEASIALIFDYVGLYEKYCL